MTKVLRLTLCSKYAQVDTHWEILCLVPCSAAEGRHMVSMMSLLSDQASSPICNFNENQTPALQLISTPRINSEEKKHSPLLEELKPPVSCYQRPGRVFRCYPEERNPLSLSDRHLLRWSTNPKSLASGNMSSNAEAQAGELWPRRVSASVRARLCWLPPRQHVYCADHTASSLPTTLTEDTTRTCLFWH